MTRFRSRVLRTRVLPVAYALALTHCGGGGSSTESAVAPTITAQPASITVAAGSAASLSVVASGSGTLSYQWRRNSASISGATSATYAIASASASDSGQYDVIVSNTAGSVTSVAARVAVTGLSAAPVITTQPVAQSVVVGSSVTFTVVASGTALSYQWRKGGTAITGATSASYSIVSATTADAGSFDVVVSNAAGTVTSTAVTLSVTAVATGTQSAKVTAAAQAFLNTLTSTQQATTQLTFSVATARRWSNLPASMVARNGISWGALTATQQAAARTLITTALGNTGNALHVGMQAADDYLNANGGGSGYGAGQYYIAMLGTPSASSFWMLQLSGHHLTFNIAFNGSYNTPTPLFLGIEPKGSFTQSGTTYDPMQVQRGAVASLGTALLSYSGAKLTGTYSDLLFGANGSGGIDNTCPRAYASVTERGLLYSALSATDQSLVQSVITAYVNTQSDEYIATLLSDYLSSTSLASTYVAYAGTGTVTANGNYFRIDGPRVWIEFSVQRGIIFNNDIHFHTIWRDKVGDYGGNCQ